MLEISDLVAGYRRFLDGHYAEHAEAYRTLADRGQAPKTMVIACCDSRADPSIIFDAGPGALFVVRNVANLVPPFEPEGDYHGTSAALEFAVTGLEVQNILVLGHARCGGVAAFLDDHFKKGPGQGSFITSWMSLMTAARNEVLAKAGDADIGAQRSLLEQVMIHHSIANLESFPFVRERVQAGRLRLHGGYFNISNGVLMAMDRISHQFKPVA